MAVSKTSKGVKKTPPTLASKKASAKVVQSAAKKAAHKKAIKGKGGVVPATAILANATDPKKAVKKSTGKGAIKPRGKAGVTKPVKEVHPPEDRAPAKLPTGVDFVAGSDMETAFKAVLEGGESRAAVAHRLAEIWKDTPTRNNGPKPVSTIINHVVRRALASGYKLVQSWQIVPGDDVPALPKPFAVATPGTKKAMGKKGTKKPAKGA
jgi:hypothetical protein